MRWVIILSFAVAGKPSAYLNTALSECDHAMIDLARMKSPDGVVSHNIKLPFQIVTYAILHFAFTYIRM